MFLIKFRAKKIMTPQVRIECNHYQSSLFFFHHRWPIANSRSIQAILRKFGLDRPRFFARILEMVGAQTWEEQRKYRVGKLAACLHEALVAPDGGRRVSLTGSLVRWSNLRTTRSKEAFRIIALALCQHESFENDTRGVRFWTKKTVEEAVRLVVKRHKICPPTGPGFDWDAWFKDQSKVIHKLCRSAARNRLATMDELQTLPVDQEDRFN